MISLRVNSFRCLLKNSFCKFIKKKKELYSFFISIFSPQQINIQKLNRFFVFSTLAVSMSKEFDHIALLYLVEGSSQGLRLAGSSFDAYIPLERLPYQRMFLALVGLPDLQKASVPKMPICASGWLLGSFA